MAFIRALGSSPTIRASENLFYPESGRHAAIAFAAIFSADGARFDYAYDRL